MEKTSIKWILILAAIVAVAFAAIKTSGSLSPTGNSIQPAQTGDVKEFNVTAFKFGFNPDTITVNKGDKVKITAESTDVAHGFAIYEYGINLRLEPGKPQTVEFVADKAGTFIYYCNIPCGEGHGKMMGTLVVK